MNETFLAFVMLSLVKKQKITEARRILIKYSDHQKKSSKKYIESTTLKDKGEATQKKKELKVLNELKFC